MNKPIIFLRLTPLIFLIPLLFSCAQTARQKLPVQLQQAERHNLRGIAAESRQKFVAAESEFIEAYRLFSAVENYRGMVISLLNNSSLYRRQGDMSKTEKVMIQVVELLPYAPELESEICFEMTKLSLSKGDNNAAMEWANRGVKSAADIDRGRMLNLQVLVFIRKTEFLQAKELARSALKASRAITDRREEANSLRILGDIAYAGNSFKEALEMYEAALSIDKELALSIRISDDLRGLAKTFASLGILESAIIHYQRSASLNIAERNYSRGAEDLEVLREMFERTNNRKRLSETAELLENIKQYMSNLEQR